MRLRDARYFRNDMSQVELERRSGVFQSRISSHERNLTTLKPGERRRIERVLNLKGMIRWENEKQQNGREDS